MGWVRTHRGWVVAIIALLIVVVAGVVGVSGCTAGNKDSKSTESAPRAPLEGTGSQALSNDWDDGSDGMVYPEEGMGEFDSGSSQSTTLAALPNAPLGGGGGQKIITDAQVEIEVEQNGFEAAFAQAVLIADRYGGYIISSNSWGGGDDDTLKSGVIAIRVPSASFDKALTDAGKLGTVKNREISTEDVTAEYVDLQARITNAKAHVQSILALMAKAETVEEILRVQQVLTAAQQELEQLQGRQRYLDEHTGYSTLTMSIYESGSVVTTSEDWGVVAALKDGLENIVGVFNAIIRGLGVLVPVLVVLVIVALIVYFVWRTAARRRRRRRVAEYQEYMQATEAAQMAAQAAAPTGAPGSAPATPAEGAAPDGEAGPQG